MRISTKGIVVVSLISSISLCSCTLNPKPTLPAPIYVELPLAQEEEDSPATKCTVSYCFNFASVPPPPMEIHDRIRTNSKDDFVERIQKEVDQTDFSNKTGFATLTLDFMSINEESKKWMGHSTSMIDINSSKRKKSISVTGYVEYSDLLRSLQEKEGFSKLILPRMYKNFIELCKRYNVKPPPVPSDLPPTERITSIKEVDRDAIDELAVSIPLKGNFAESSEYWGNVSVSESLEATLAAHNLGKWDGADTGAGFQTDYFVGPNSDKMFEALKPQLDQLPTDSRIERKRQGVRRTFELKRKTDPH